MREITLHAGCCALKQCTPSSVVMILGWNHSGIGFSQVRIFITFQKLMTQIQIPDKNGIITPIGLLGSRTGIDSGIGAISSSDSIQKRNHNTNSVRPSVRFCLPLPLPRRRRLLGSCFAFCLPRTRTHAGTAIRYVAACGPAAPPS